MKMPKDNLEHMKKCPICKKAYKGEKTVVLDSNSNKTTFHLTCSNCNISSLVFVVANKLGVVSLGMLTDLSSREAKQFFQGEAISSDQVIAVHKYLKSIKHKA